MGGLVELCKCSLIEVFGAQHLVPGLVQVNKSVISALRKHVNVRILLIQEPGQIGRDSADISSSSSDSGCGVVVVVVVVGGRVGRWVFGGGGRVRCGGGGCGGSTQQK